ncbi:phage tail assembly protein [Bartonella koehlerae]|uniref:Uncharacterized protein n=1 Tax=Bartonella koehlerae C-29 TaxID=1134510 RepID=A0A067W7B7_9HYPH|nr:phage tail assembly protein [Bartonella koehlerae]KEC54746.1 hypothetical protein O9A_01360 [Bartonella koehlerae C-29]
MNRTKLYKPPITNTVKVAGKTYTEINLRFLKFKDLETIEKKDGIEQIREIIVSLSGWSYNAINELDTCDF